jgi:tetratricopeptide (TPR) repeat protein
MTRPEYPKRNLEKAEAMWRGCLEAGEMRAHFGLGYTLCDLGRPAEAFGHLAMYTEICPRNSWAWVWRGRAARDMGELAEARSCFQRAIRCEDEFEATETDAREFLAALDATRD